MILSHEGFSLVEVLVSLLLGMILITSAGQLLVSTNKTYVLQDELVRIQESARVTLDLLTRNVRMAAYTGCPSWTNLGNALFSDKPSRLWMAHFDKGIIGISAGTSAKNSVDNKAVSEAIVIHKVDWEGSIPVASQDNASMLITLQARHDFNQGDLLALVSQDCKQISIFIAGSSTSGAKVSYSTISSESLYNCTHRHQGSFNCMESQRGEKLFDHSQSQLVPVSSAAYYIRNNNGIPTLYMKRGGEAVSGRGLAAEALVEGVEELRVFYGYDADNDGIVNQYLLSSDIPLYSDEWKNIVSVKIEILIRSYREISPQPQTYFFAGSDITSDDKYIRRSFMATIELRNRVP
ncbi:MAG: PilW family protein [Candidatus Endonucleobacter bathymodioli]|uniref:PilW family protein n=1 Tax=Candidatus Endonucleibacter bathymodioli TaxID=539814 RepID=A0AA90NXH7_9GAMM|nr:PilW family protein [Candidatus Endonucleobacter bathymodioli]